MTKKEIISKLRGEGKGLKEIMLITGFSKSVVNYHSSAKIRENLRKTHALPKGRKNARFYGKIKRFNRDGMGNGITAEDVINKFGWTTTCYLTGKPIHLLDDVYHFDHINPVSQGGSNTIDNLGIATAIANQSKSSMTLEEYLQHCRLVLETHKI